MVFLLRLTDESESDTLPDRFLLLPPMVVRRLLLERLLSESLWSDTDPPREVRRLLVRAAGFFFAGGSFLSSSGDGGTAGMGDMGAMESEGIVLSCLPVRMDLEGF